MINFDKHTIRLGTGDVDINVLESSSGYPVLAFSNSDEEFSMSGSMFFSNSDEEFSMSGSMFMGFDCAESIDGLITILRSIRRSYFPERAKKALADTQRFDF